MLYCSIGSPTFTHARLMGRGWETPHVIGTGDTQAGNNHGDFAHSETHFTLGATA